MKIISEYEFPSINNDKLIMDNYFHPTKGEIFRVAYFAKEANAIDYDMRPWSPEYFRDYFLAKMAFEFRARDDKPHKESNIVSDIF